MKTFRMTVALIAVLLTIASTKAINFDLHSSSATKHSGNLVGDFADIDDDGSIAGDAAGLYTSTLGGSAANGFWVKIDFGTNPQPLLTSASLKAGPSYLLWDLVDLALFNAGTFTSITLWNDGNKTTGIKNKPDKAFLGTSHAGLEGTSGTVTRVPDGGATAALLGLGLIGLTMMRRRK